AQAQTRVPEAEARGPSPGEGIGARAAGARHAAGHPGVRRRGGRHSRRAERIPRAGFELRRRWGRRLSWRRCRTGVRALIRMRVRGVRAALTLAAASILALALAPGAQAQADGTFRLVQCDPLHSGMGEAVRSVTK